jgi:hypothetical protein
MRLDALMSDRVLYLLGCAAPPVLDAPRATRAAGAGAPGTGTPPHGPWGVVLAAVTRGVG